jgi:para-nitrobenzyl esterase
MLRIIGTAVVSALVLASQALATPVQTQGGLVEGTAQDGIATYKGIPFAAPPVGDLRWRAPQPVIPWNGVRKADRFAPSCEQDQSMNAFIGFPVLPMSEDCLYLNIWTPAKSPSEHLPVMVWIYGGGFTSGATGYLLYDGTKLAHHGVIIVSIAYRVGPFGFLAHPDLDRESPAHASGTYGLMDQIAGLQWVKANIAAFGGDPANVTIFGESAGGISVSMLAASPKAKGLFARAISESGGSFAPARQKGNEGGMNVPSLALAEKQGTEFVAKLGAKSITEARKVPADAIVKAAGPALATFWPALDGDVLVDDQYRMYEAGNYNDVPVLIGTNSDEGSMFVRSATVAGFTDSIRAGYGDHAQKILAAYPSADDREALKSGQNVFRDTAFAWHTWSWARLQSGAGRSKVFVYYFTHRPPFPDTSMFKDAGASHGAEIAYVFGNPSTLETLWSAADRKVTDAMQTYWTNFARTGDPNGGGMPAWPAFAGSNPQVMQLDAAPAAIAVPNIGQLRVLDGYYAWRRSQEPRAQAAK